MTATVLLTGASGFIATHILELLVKRGYNIVATVRSQDKADFIKEKFPNGSIEIEFVKDIAADGAFDHVYQAHPSIEYVLHTASPFFNPSDKPVETVLNPALHGTQGILKATQKFGKNVKHVTITSSFAAILNPLHQGAQSELFYDENSWNPVTWDQGAENLNLTYIASKKVAEKALWDFVEAEKPSWKATAINPPWVWGPVIHKIDSEDAINTSNAILYKLSKAKTEEEAKAVIPTDFIQLWIDVRDLAEAHILSFEKADKSSGKRWFVTPGYASAPEILQAIDSIPEFKGKVYTTKPLTSEEVTEKTAKFDNHLTNEESGLKYHSIQESVVDTIKSLKKFY